MDERKVTLLKYLTEHCDEGYKVIETKELLNALKRLKGDFYDMENDLNFLASRNYIDIRYIDEDTICLSVLNNSMVFQENVEIEHSTSRTYVKFMFLTMIGSGVMAFIGSMLAKFLFG